MSTHVSSGSGLSGLPLSLVSTDGDLTEPGCSCLGASEFDSDGVRMRVKVTLPMERLPRLTWGASSPQGPKACATMSDCVLQACVRRWQAER